MWRNLTRGLYEFLTELQLEEQIHQAQEAFEEAGEELLASQYRQIYKIVVDLLDKTGGSAGRGKTVHPGLCGRAGGRLCIGKVGAIHRERTV